ncbi:MAG: hydroxymethylbilane synthase [Acidobacteriales bacterium]|nr:hydroxymethylbilane synthase [Terriglobales bacterium]
MAHLRIGSRGSQLALWQSNHIATLLRGQGHTVALEIIKTTGDKITDVPLAKIGAKGLFTSEIEEALAANQVDLAIHSLKDLPTELPPGFELAAVPAREDPRDAFVSTKYPSLRDLPKGARVGTSSLRRQAQLRALRQDLELHALRGNVDTRLRKLVSGEYDAVILAHAGLKRLGRIEYVRQVLDPGEMCPAAGQGALGIEIREGDTGVRQALAFLDHPGARAAVSCERATLNALGGGCQVPIGVHAQVAGRVVRVEGVVATPDGARVIRLSLEGDAAQPVHVGEELGRELLAAGAGDILKEVYGANAAFPEQP